MDPTPSDQTRRQLSIFLADGFSMLALTSLITPLGTANKTLGYPAYEWRFVSERDDDIVSDCGIRITPDTRTDVEKRRAPDASEKFIALISNYSVDGSCGEHTISWIRKALAEGAEVAGIYGGAQTLAEHGLLKHRRCAAHWDWYPASLEKYPDVKVLPSYFEVDGPFYTCAGGAAVFDLSLHLIKRDFGAQLAERVGQIALHGTPRIIGERQVSGVHTRLDTIGSPLLQIVKLMEQHISEPQSVDQLISGSHYSRRQIERLFQQQLGLSPGKYYQQVRIERARSLLRNSSLPIIEIAIATGFMSTSHFSKVYKTVVGRSPLQTRAAAHIEKGLPARLRSFSAETRLTTVESGLVAQTLHCRRNDSNTIRKSNMTP